MKKKQCALKVAPIMHSRTKTRLSYLKYKSNFEMLIFYITKVANEYHLIVSFYSSLWTLETAGAPQAAVLPKKFWLSFSPMKTTLL